MTTTTRVARTSWVDIDCMDIQCSMALIVGQLGIYVSSSGIYWMIARLVALVVNILY